MNRNGLLLVALALCALLAVAGLGAATWMWLGTSEQPPPPVPAAPPPGWPRDVVEEPAPEEGSDTPAEPTPAAEPTAGGDPASASRQPLSALAQRVKRIVASMPASSRPWLLTWDCRERGRDCRLQGHVTESSHLFHLSHRLEEDPQASGEVVPQVEVLELETTDDGGKVFTLSVVAP